MIRGGTRSCVYLTWRNIFAIAGINSLTADEGLQLMGFDVDASTGYEVVNHDNQALQLSGKFVSASLRLMDYRDNPHH